MKKMVNLDTHFIEVEKEINKKKFQPVSYLRRKFDLQKEINEVKLHITALGLYKGFLNGKPITEQVFMPGFTYYKKRLQYQTYDVTLLLKKGNNVISVMLGDGWYRGKIGIFSKRNFYGEKTKLAAVLNISFADGTTETITTDDQWKVTQDGPIRKSDWKDGEIYDARRELTGWMDPDYDDSSWHGVYPGKYNGVIVPSEGEKIVEHERFTPEVLKTPEGSTILNFKQNLFGYVEFTVTGKSGLKVKLTHGEALDEKGNFTLKNLIANGLLGARGNFQEIEYILKDGTQTYKPSFTAHGFQYVKVENWPEEVKPENFTSIAVYSDMEQIGEFECSNTLINQLVSNSRWSQKSNFVDIPTDCPQRERAGWTGDISCYSPTASYLMNVDKFLAKWLKDVALQQTENGLVGSIVPDVGLPSFMDGAAGWADAIIIVPYVLYQAYGNQKVLEDQYESMVKWIAFLENRAKKTHRSRWFKKNPYKNYTIDYGFHWGEWQEPGRPMSKDAVKGFFNPDFEVATAYYAHSADLMVKIATALGKSEDAEKYRTLFENIKKGYRYNYTINGIVDSDRQCKYVRPVAFNLISEEEKIANITKLNEIVKENEYKIGTGFLTTPSVLQMLADFGFIETAYCMLENEERPGWLYAVKKGASTIWENWNGIDDKGKPADSFNHYLMGSVTGFLFSHVAGIRPLEPGYEKVQIKPLPGRTLTFVNCSYVSAAGLIKSSWKIEDKKFNLNIEVPVETEVHLPDGTVQQVSKGMHEFSCKLKENS
jgi:alpha-L-rhamnosidase